MLQNIIQKQKQLKLQVLTIIASIAGAVLLPQLLHAIGALTGLGTAVGEVFLPMQFPVFLAGFIAGPVAGLLTGIASPLISFAISGMPSAAMLPLMIIELTVYGVATGFLCKTKMSTLANVIIAQILGRILKFGAAALAVFIFSNSYVSLSTMFNGMLLGLPGLVLQWVFLPLIVFWFTSKKAAND